MENYVEKSSLDLYVKLHAKIMLTIIGHQSSSLQRGTSSLYNRLYSQRIIIKTRIAKENHKSFNYKMYQMYKMYHSLYNSYSMMQLEIMQQIITIAQVSPDLSQIIVISKFLTD